MAISVFPVPNGSASDNWVLMSSVTPTAGATTVTFSSIALRQKLLMKFNNITFGTANVTITFNGDTSSKYTLYATGTSGASLITALQLQNFTGLQFTSSLLSLNGVMTVDEANTTGIKNIGGSIKVTTPSPVNVYPAIFGTYEASAAISSITITVTSTFSATGTIDLFGVAV